MTTSNRTIKTFLQANSAAPSLGSGGVDRAARSFLVADEEIERIEAMVVAKQPDLPLLLLRADATYEPIAEVIRHHRAYQHVPRSLVGPAGELQGLLALQALVPQIQKENEPMWRPELVEELSGAAKQLLDIEVPADLVEVYHSARKTRGDAVKALLDADLIPREGPRSDPRIDTVKKGLPGRDDRGSEWADSVVQVTANGLKPKVGSGVFLGSYLVLTAAHVVVGAHSVTVASPRLGRSFRVRDVKVHPGFSQGRVDCDYALIEVEHAPGLGVWRKRDFGASGGRHSVVRYGFPTSGSRFGEGSVERIGDGRAFFSDDLTVPPGASGGGLFHASGDKVYLVGITTNDDTPTGPNKSYVGLALSGMYELLPEKQ
ncbi:trypsin-like serine peptidase [Polyangium fumosum]|uniref:Serine protease n=1 Tax=Polyangium fumosum TaxID=889272 RepID=A0A4U1J927_9BACT|nr:serine protease [Polyangium fumosum]TKD04497.1 serine protease [Polyangium fumosum]